MFRYFKALFYLLTGRISEARNSLLSNKYVVGATYDASIARSGQRQKQLHDAVTEFVVIEEKRKEYLRVKGDDIKRYERIKLGSQTAMQNRINTLRNSGAERAVIESDAEFLRHKTAYAAASESLEKAHTDYDEKEADLKARQKSIAEYKTELQNMGRSREKLQEERSEVIADLAIAQQAETAAALVSGLSSDSTDRDLADVREAHKRAKARASVTMELAGGSKVADSEYEKLAGQRTTGTELDKLLDWGEAKPEDATVMKPAKIKE